jgi:hypothetical protein
MPLYLWLLDLPLVLLGAVVIAWMVFDAGH